MPNKTATILKNPENLKFLQDPMLATLKLHPAWKNDFTLFQSETLLKNHPPYTYLLRPGETPYHFLISYVKNDSTIQHIPFKIELTLRKWSYRNGIGIISEDLDEFIPLVMHCKKNECRSAI